VSDEDIVQLFHGIYAEGLAALRQTILSRVG